MDINKTNVETILNDFNLIRDNAEKIWQGEGVKKDRPSSFTLWMKAYELNSQDNLVTRRLGSCYRFGHGVDINNEIAKRYYLEAASRNDSASQYFLGKIFEENNSVECITWYEKALSNGDMDNRGSETF